MLPANPFLCNAGDSDPYCINENPTFQEYKVYVRLVGNPDTKIGVTTCADEATVDIDGDGILNDEIVCSTESVVKVRMKGKNNRMFENVTRQLLTLCLDTFVDGNLDGTCDIRYSLFDPALEDYFWQWNTSGKAHAQLVFIPLPD